jgi:dienelactone hydrolase
MTGVAVAPAESPIYRVASVARALTREVNLAMVGLGLVALHVLDDSFLRPEPGVERSDHLVSGLVPLALLALAAWAYRRSRPGARASIALAAGVFGLVASVEAIYAAAEGAGALGDDSTGFATLPAGVLLIGLGVVALWRSRRRDGRRVRRYLRRVLMLVVAIVMAVSVVLPTGAAYLFTHIGRGIVTGADLGAPAQAVTLQTSDGLTLTGSYVPSRNGAAVIVSPGYNSTPDHARMLVRHGYGVLLFDQRGEGRSDGDPNAFGWSAEKDHNAAIAFLRSRPDVDPDRIGGLGLSVAGETLLQTAAHNHGLRAVVSEGAGNRSVREVRDMPASPESWVWMPSHYVLTAMTALFANEAPPANLRHLVPRIAPRPIFLISAGHGVDSEVLNKQFFAAAGEPRTLWEIPEAGHTGGLESRPAEYEQRVVGFFDRALSGR